MVVEAATEVRDNLAATITVDEAVDLAKRLTTTTDLLTRMLKRDKMKPTPGDLSAVLVAGRFVAKDATVSGTWPLERRFLESLLAEKLQ